MTINIERTSRNKTLHLTKRDISRLQSQLTHIDAPCVSPKEGVVVGDCYKIVQFLSKNHVDLLFLDPPYNLTKSFNGVKFSRQKVDEYTNWFDMTVRSFVPLLKSNASIYICGDWLTSQSIYTVASKYFKVRNRITWEREKGRGAKKNWKNSCEDVWFCTMSDDYVFNVESVKLRRQVIAPYTNLDGTPKDWKATSNGKFRDTYPSNIWTDITIPFWSMPENTDHPTQKSEKLLAKILLASGNLNSFVLDPFLGSGTTAVVAKKLGYRSLGIEISEEYALLALRRLELVDDNPLIQGYSNGVFWERNTLALQRKETTVR